MTTLLGAVQDAEIQEPETRGHINMPQAEVHNGTKGQCWGTPGREAHRERLVQLGLALNQEGRVGGGQGKMNNRTEDHKM